MCPDTIFVPTRRMASDPGIGWRCLAVHGNLRRNLWYGVAMTSEPPRKSPFSNPILTIAILPIAVGFIIAASLSAGPREVFKALTVKK